MRLLTDRARVICDCLSGAARVVSKRQDWVRVDGRPLLVENDPVGWRVRRCPLPPVQRKRCTRTRAVLRGYSAWLRVDGRRVCVDALRGRHDDDLGTAAYTVRDPGQEFVDADGPVGGTGES